MQARFKLLALLTAALAVAVAGCSTDDGVRSVASPQTHAAASLPQFLKASGAHGAHALGFNGSTGGYDSQYKTQYVYALWGAKVTCGRYRVTIPPGALQNDMFITVRDAGQGTVMCELLPHGTRFLRPVRLQMDLTGLDLGSYNDWTIFWYNDSADAWEDQDATLDDSTLTTYLWHFSDYAAGRGGW